MQLSLSAKMQKLIDDRVKSGKYRTAEDVVSAGLATLNQQERPGDFAPGELDELLAEADAEIERGQVLEGEAVFAELLRRGHGRQSKAS